MYARIQYEAYEESFTPRDGSKRLTPWSRPTLPSLDQVEQVRPDASVLHRDLDHEAQVGEHQLLRGLGILVIMYQDRQLALLLTGQE